MKLNLKLTPFILMFAMILVSFSTVIFAADMTGLTAKIDDQYSIPRTTMKLVQANYTSDSWKVYTDAIAAAVTVEGNTDATQQEADNAAGAIDTAKASLVVDTTALMVKINDQYSVPRTLIKLKEAYYSVNSWKAYTDAIAAAVVIEGKGYPAVQEVADAMAAIDTAKLALVVDVTALTAKIDDEYSIPRTLIKLKEAYYSVNSWKVYTDAIATAVVVEGKGNATAQEVADAIAAIDTTRAALVFDAKAALDAVKAYINSLNPADYTTESWSYVIAVMAYPETTNMEIEQKYHSFADVVLLNLIFAGKENLNTAKAAANGKVQADYTATSWSTYIAARTVALTMPEITNTQVVTKVAAINTAVNALVFAGKANLDVAIANAATKVQANYTATSWNKLVVALALPEVTNANIVAKTTAINSAINGLAPATVSYKITAKSGLICRATASVNGKKVTSYSYNATIQVYEIKNGWARTANGWLSTSYIKAASVTTPSTPSNSSIVSYKVTARSGLICRATASANGKKVTSYKYNGVLQVYEIKNGWARTANGWVSTSYLKKV